MTTVPERPAASTAGGLWFVFDDGGNRFALSVSPGGSGRVFVNGELQAEQAWIRAEWRHAVSRDGHDYELRFTAGRALRGESRCVLLRDGEEVDTLATRYLPARAPWATPAYLAAGLAVGLGATALGLELWQLVLVVVVLVLAGRRLMGPRRGGYLIGRPPEIARQVQHRMLRAGRAVPHRLGGLVRLMRNLRAGGRLAFGLPVAARTFRIDLDQVLWLALVSAGLWASGEFLRVDPPRVLVPWALVREASLFLLFFALVVGLAIGLDLQRHVAALATMLLAASVWQSVVLLLVEHLDWLSPQADDGVQGYLLLALVAAWSLVIALRALGRVANVARARRLVASLGYVAVSYGALLVVPPVPLWYTDYAEAGAQHAWTPLDVEGVYYRQAALLDDAVDALAPEIPGETDVYFVGFASYAEQDVFLREVEHVRRTVGERFSAGERSLVLVNHRDTLDSAPLANRPNLERALRAVGRRMDPEEDVLFLYLTSHGSQDATLSVSFFELSPNPLTAAQLRAMLDASGIRWRIVVISACYSGSFVDSLHDEYTLVLTAAHAENTSFGCSNDRELTYFAEHLFAKAWQPGEPLLEAFDRARASLEARERAEGYEFSDPQRFVGARMAQKLEHLEARRQRYGGLVER